MTTAKIGKIQVVTDTFTQCQNPRCQKWLRLFGTGDETGWRTIPLYNVKDYSGKKEIWVCEQCFDSVQQEDDDSREV